MDKYVKVREIGEGSFGKAFLVRTKSNGKQLVIKEINMKKMQRKEREEARKEVAVLAQLHHPNIVCYRESFEEIGNLYIAMDYCDGGDLYGRINKQRGLLFTEDQVLDWFVQTCLAIKHIHDRKILHRDIKSQNIFLTRHGIVKLGDFGIAKVLNSTVELARTCIGTPYYLSPEICENKPYNNKSDIWSLGCVLYELSTLKHAFEAGNMKNLVLKIIRGSYPAPPPRYSYDLRSLIAILFKRNPRDRPSINTVLRKSLLQSRIRKFLSENEVADEFSHTVMHGVKIKKQVPPGDARPLPPKPQLVNKPPTPATPRYNPASVYAPSGARKSANSNNRKSSDARPSSANARKPGPSPSPAGNAASDLARRRQELVEKERRRREDARKREEQVKQQQYAKKHQELVEKQKQARLQRAREEGWKGLMDSLSSEDGDKSGPGQKKDIFAKPATPKPTPAGNRGKYEHYHDYLDKLDDDRQAAKNDRPAPQAHLGVAGALGGRASPAPGAAAAAKQGAAAGARGAEAASRARVYGEYMQRKQAAAVNKARAHGDLYGGAAGAVSPRVNKDKIPAPTPSPSRPGVRGDQPGVRGDARSPGGARGSRDRNEEDYLARLKQIRLQNYNERKNVKGKVADPKYKPPVDPRNDVDSRRKKIEALKAQADDRARKLREELDRKRKEAYEFEQKKLRDQAKGKAADRVQKPAAKPAPPVPMTEAMKAIGVIPDKPKPQIAQLEKCPVGMTAAMEAIGATPAAADPEADRKKKKEAILKRLNAKPPFADKPTKPAKPDKPSERPKWGEPGAHKPTVAERLRWGTADEAANLRAKSLEETGSHMEATKASDAVLKHAVPASPEEPAQDTPSARRQWGGPAGTVLNVLEQADLSEGGTLRSEASDSSEPPHDASIDDAKPSTKAPAIGTTITIARNPGKGTVVIRKAEEPSTENQDTSSTLPATNSTTAETQATPTPEPKDEESSENVDKSQSSKSLFERVALDEDDDAIHSKDGEELAVEDIENVEEESKGTTTKTDETNESSPEEEEKDTAGQNPLSKTLSALSSKQTAAILNKSVKDPGLAIGLSTGCFDTDVAMLRTCSEPDLAKLFRTLQQKAEIPAGLDELAALDIAEGVSLEEDGEDEEEAVDTNSSGELGTQDGLEPYDPDFEDIEGEEDDEDEDEEKTTSEDKSEDTKEEEEDEEAQEEDSDEDLNTMRESMMSLLATKDADASEEPLNPGRKKKAVKKGTTKKGKKLKKKKKKDSSEDSTSRSKAWARGSIEDLQSMKETMKTLLQPASEATRPKQSTLKSIKEHNGGSGDAKEISTLQLDTESWQSDDDNPDDDYFEEEDMFSRLESSRAHLEQELGCDTFMKAYKTVQAIHEDEDENMEEGIHLVSGILGHDKIHHYPAILQLVMADGVYTEDND